MATTKLYHYTLRQIRGGALVPLTELRAINPDVYYAALQEYQAREKRVMHYNMTFDKSWDQMVSLTAVPPDVFFSTLAEYGLQRGGLRCHEVDLLDLVPTNITGFQPDRDAGTDLRFSHALVEKFRSVDELAREHYVALQGQWSTVGELFQGMTTFLYAGSIKLRQVTFATM
jgi:hypothetical protein